MRGEDQQQGAMFSYLSPEQRVPQQHPLRGASRRAGTRAMIRRSLWKRCAGKT